jgi:hypothetical protein
MDTLVRFGSGAEQYTFNQANLVSLRDNFRDLVQQATRLPGLSGGVNEYGTGPSPRAIGNVQAVFWLLADDNLTPGQQAAQIEALKSDVARMSSFGVKRLYKQPSDASEEERYCEASISSISYTETASEQPHARLRMQVNWQVTNPRWYAQGTEAPAWGDGTIWGAGLAWGGTAPVYNISGTSTDITLTTTGNAETFPRIIIQCGAAQTAENIRIQRIVNGAVVDQVRYAGVLGNNDRLVINTRANTVTKNNVSHYTSDYTYNNAGWFRLQPGANTIKVLLDNSGDACDVEFRYYEAYT